MASSDYNKVLRPGFKFPDLTLKTYDGKAVVLDGSGSKPTLVVFYRGFFCPFCNMHVDYLKQEFHKLEAQGIELVVASADSLEASTGMAEKRGGFPFSFCYGLTTDQLKAAGVYISSPRHYQPQTQNFSEPAWFFLLPDGTIKYMDLATAPMGGRVNVDNLIAAHNWSTQNGIEHPEFAKTYWGSVPNW